MIIVNKDASYVYVYIVSRENLSCNPGVPTVLDTAIQKFNTGSSGSQKIFAPIQIVVASLSSQAVSSSSCDCILLSTSSGWT